MFPPQQRKHTSSAMHEFQQRPHFMAPSGPVTKAKPAQQALENLDSPMQRSCQHSHQRVAEPLLTVNRYREDYAPRFANTRGAAPNPRLAPKATTARQHLVSTWN